MMVINMQKKQSLYILLILVVLCIQVKAIDIPITKYGAKGDGKSVNTKAIQKAIDECTKTGGTVIVPQGRFVTGTIYLKSNVTLFLEKGALMLGSIDSLDYTPNSPTTVTCVSTHSRNGKSKLNYALIYAEDQDNISICGPGTIDGQGGAARYQKGDNGHNRPKLIFIISCRNVLVRDVFLTNSAFWMQDYLGCDGVTIDNIRVLNHANWNNDGLDIDSKNVRVSNSFIDSDDDAICLKSYLKDRPCENVTITNCVAASNCDGIKMGTPGAGGFKNIAINNCTVTESKFDNFRKWQTRDKYISAEKSMVAGISVECVDGGSTDGIVIDNITMRAVQTPIYIRLGSRLEKMNGDESRKSSLRNVIISNIISDQLSRRTSSITAIPGSYIENVKLSHMIFDIHSEGTKEDSAIAVPEKENAYPSPHSFGNTLPAYGFYIRHVKNISISDVQFNVLKTEARPPLVMEDVDYGAFNDMTIKSRETGTRMLVPEDLKIEKSRQISIDRKNLF